MNAEQFANEYYQADRSKVETVSLKSAILFAEAFHAKQLIEADTRNGCTVYSPDNTGTSSLCAKCGRGKWEHNEIKLG